MERVRSDGGGVVLMHDLDRSPKTRAARHAHVLRTTTQLLALARSEGWLLCTLGNLMRPRVPNDGE